MILLHSWSHSTHYHFFVCCSAMVSRLCSCKQLVLAFSTVFSCYLFFFSPLVLLLFFSCCCFCFGDHGALRCRAGIVVGSWLSMVFMMYCFHVTSFVWLILKLSNNVEQKIVVVKLALCGVHDVLFSCCCFCFHDLKASWLCWAEKCSGKLALCGVVREQHHEIA